MDKNLCYCIPNEQKVVHQAPWYVGDLLVPINYLNFFFLIKQLDTLFT